MSDHGFSSHPGHGDSQKIIAAMDGINHDNVSAAFESYKTDYDAPILNPEVTVTPRVVVRSID